MNPFEQFLQRILGAAQPPAPRDVTMTPVPQQVGANAMSYELFNQLPQISQILSSGAGFNVAQDPFGNTFRSEGSLPWRNNNPGNIKAGSFAKKRGSVGESAGFAVFPTQEAGMNALRELLFQPDSKYRNMSVTKAISTFAPPQDKNDTKNYQKFVTSLVGTNNPISKLNQDQREALLNAILRMEGFYKGGQIEMGGRQWNPPTKPRSMP